MICIEFDYTTYITETQCDQLAELRRHSVQLFSMLLEVNARDGLVRVDVLFKPLAVEEVRYKLKYRICK